MRDTKERFNLSTGVSIDVAHTRPENTLGALAVRLAEAYNRISIATKEDTAFAAQENSERRKAGDMTTVVFQLQERDRENTSLAAQGLPPVVRRRMDPLTTYDLAACTAERRLCLDRAQKYRVMSDERKEIVKQTEILISSLSKDIAAAQTFAKQG